MIYVREYKGLTVQIEAAWSEDNRSNLYRWRVVSSTRVINIEGKHPLRSWEACWAEACEGIDRAGF